mmetsp:Transcript_23783/g.51583  ORF Transcript_23783/g.51583 Transcript_23783/m.51583 type:complete len:84 (+) Transcript_23783:149-400(+)
MLMWRRWRLQDSFRSAQFGIKDEIITCSGHRVCVWRLGQDKPERTFFARMKLRCLAVSLVTPRRSRVWFAAGDKNGNVYMLGD